MPPIHRTSKHDRGDSCGGRSEERAESSGRMLDAPSNGTGVRERMLDAPSNGTGVRGRMLDAPSNGTGVRGRPPAGRNAPRRRRGRSAARGPVPLALQQKGRKALTRQVHLRTLPKPNRAERRNRDALGGALACHQQSSRSLSNSTNAAFKRARQFMFEAERAGVAG